jgi:NAD(P)-dependent dehydrogenase (short-subunit alcohol dehydrogenase family)
MTDGRVAVVVGGAGGIGSAVAHKLMRLGVRVVIADLDSAAARQGASTGADMAAMRVDVTDESSVSEFFAEFDSRYSRLDMLVNCAGVSPRIMGRRPSVDETPLDVWQRTLAINLTGTFLTCRAAVPRMRKNKGGRIVNIASMAGRTIGEATSSYYAASKSGVLGFSRVLAAEVGRYGITVNCVAPSRVDTAMARTLTNTAAVDQQYVEKTPMGRIGRPEDVAAAVGYFLSEDASFVTGAILDVTGGYFMP